MTRVYRCAMPVAILLLSLVNLPARAQNPAGGYLAPLEIKKELQLKEKRHRELENSVGKLFNNTGSFDAQAQNDAREWFEGFVFPAMTTPDLYQKAGELRHRYTTGLQQVKQPQVFDFLVNLMFSNAKTLADSNYPPQTRVSAVALIAELNDGDKVLGTQRIPAPYAPALVYLREKLNDPNQIDGVRLVALSGILRHVESFWWKDAPPDNALIDGLQRDMLSIVTATEAPAGRSPEAHAWFRGRAIDVLGSLNGWTPNSASFAALSDILADPNASISLRCRAAYAIGRFDYTKLQAVDPVDLPTLTGNIAGLLADACKNEVAYLDRKQDEILGGGGMLGGSGMMGGNMPMMSGGAMSGSMMTGGAMMGGAAGRGGPGGKTGGAGANKNRNKDKEKEKEPGGARSSSPFESSGGFGSSAPAASGPQTGGLPVHFVDASRRRLLYEVACVRTSVNGPEDPFKGLGALAANNAKAQADITAINTSIEDLVQAIDQKEYSLNEILKTVRAQMQTLDGMRPQAATEEPDVPVNDVPTPDTPADTPTPTETPDTNSTPAAESSPPATGNK